MAKRDWVEEPAIQKIFKEHPIMAHLVMAESSGNPDAINKKSGAVGLAQLMPGTAKGGKDSKGRKTYAHGMYGKTLSDAEMRDPVKNLKFASEYLTALKKTFGNTEDALRAYNWGPGKVKKWIKQGRPEEKLPKETRNYVRKIRSRVGQTPPFVKAASAAERKRRGKPTEGVDPSAEARQLRLIKRDKGEGKMATPGQIKRLEQLIEMYKKGGGSKKMLAPMQKRLSKMKGEVAKPVRAVKADPKTKLITSSKTGKGEKPSNVVSQAEKLLKKDRPSSKVVSKVVRDAMAKDKARKATAKKTAAIASKMDAPGSGKTRAARPVTKPKKLTAAEQRAKARREAGKSVSYGGDEPVQTVGTGLRDAAAKAARKKERERLKTIKTPTKEEIRDLELIKPGADAIAGRGNRAARLRKAAAETDRKLKAKAAARKKERERLKTIKTPTKKQIRDLELIKPGAAAARKRERAKAAAAANIPYTLEGIGKARKVVARHPTERINKREQEARLEAEKKRRAIAKAKRRAGEFADTKVIKPIKDSKVPVSREVKEREFLGFGGGIDPAAGVPFKIPTKRKRKRAIDPKERVDAAESVATFEPGRVGGSGMRLPPATKKPKTTSADLHADAPKPGMGFDAALAAQKPGMGFDAALAARKAGPKKEKVTEKRIADDVEGYDPVTGRPSGEDAPKEYSFKDLLGSLDITRADDEPEYEGRKHGGKVRKTKKKAKSRKRAALRGWGKALRGY